MNYVTLRKEAMRIQSRVVIILFLVFVIGIGFFTYKILSNFSMMQESINSLQQHFINNSSDKLSQSTIQEEQSSYDTAVSSQLWERLQKKLQNTVVQLHVCCAEKNILQPYKAPKVGQCTGSGFIISDNGEIATNAHVIDGATSIVIQMPAFGKHQFEVDMVGIMPEKDIALVKLRADDIEMIVNTLGKMPKLTLGDSDSVVRSQEILALGYPLGQQALKSTTGVISGRESGMIQMSAPINPGNSGGPSVNCKGEVIGINSANVPSAQNVGYIIAINDFKNFLDALRTGGLVRKPYLGVYQAMATEDLVKSLGNPMPGGTYVVEVMCDSPLLGELQPGDMIYDINGTAVDLYGELSVPWSEDKITTAEYISRLKVGQQVVLTVYRKGKRMHFECAFERKKFAPIRHVYTEYEELPYEIFGGFVVMPLMLNHIPHLIQAAPGLVKFAEEKNQCDSALIISYVLPDSPAFKARLRLSGSIIKTVNGKTVKTLKELQDALISSGDMITMETTDNILVALAKDRICKAEPALAKTSGYQITKSMQVLMQQAEELAKKSSDKQV